MEWLLELIGEGIRDFFVELAKPKVEIAVPAETIIERKNQKTGEIEKWAQLQLRTRSKRQCKGCYVKLTSVCKLNADDSVAGDDIITDEIMLRWAGAQSEYPADIDREDPALFDLFRIEGHRLVLTPRNGSVPETALDNIGRYKLRLSVISPAVRDYDTWIEVASNGLTSEPSVRIFGQSKGR